tara:strand:- start:242 stop:478 length:237 start_codon:yes stop_codon:yes gene_type:complete
MSSKAIKTKLSQEVKEVLKETKKPARERPNIDHLIKRILVDRRKENKKNLIIMTFIIMTFIIMTFIILTIDATIILSL